jgi:hypothetical protein
LCASARSGRSHVAGIVDWKEGSMSQGIADCHGKQGGNALFMR